MITLRHLVTCNLVIITLLLAGLLATGWRYNKSLTDYRRVSQLSSELIFSYTTIREQAIEALLVGNRQQLDKVADQFESLHGRFSAMLENNVIPSHYKLSLLGDINLSGLIVSLRQELASEKKGQAEIIGQLRQLNEQFLAFDRVVTTEMKERLIHWLQVTLALTGLLICLLLFSLITIYRRGVAPLPLIARQLEESEGAAIDLKAAKGSSREIGRFVTALNRFQGARVSPAADNGKEKKQRTEDCAAFNKVINHLNGIINYAQLLSDSWAERGKEEEQRAILEKIISTSERGADILQQRLQGGDR
ncbi:MAG: hypothetical protein ABFR97_01220 [Thermodesulfobacteriota bacterium]